MQFEQETRKLLKERNLSPKKVRAEMIKLYGGKNKKKLLGWRWIHAFRGDERGTYDIKKVQILYNYLTE